MEWTSQYGCHRLVVIRGALQVNVVFEKDGYKVSCNELTLKKRDFKSVDEAKAAGIRLAKTVGKRITDELEEFV